MAFVPQLLAACARLDHLSHRGGRLLATLLLALLVPVLLLACVQGVGLRSVAWQDIQWYLFSALFLFRSVQRRRHTHPQRLQRLLARWSPRLRAALDVLLHVLLWLPLVAVLGWLAWTNLGRVQMQVWSVWLALPLRVLIALGFSLLALRLLAETLTLLTIVLHPRSLASTEPAHA